MLLRDPRLRLEAVTPVAAWGRRAQRQKRQRRLWLFGKVEGGGWEQRAASHMWTCHITEHETQGRPKGKSEAKTKTGGQETGFQRAAVSSPKWALQTRAGAKKEASLMFTHSQ